MQSRRHGSELETTILDAAWAEIQEKGYARLTVEGVAARAHTGKQVLYRRWANRQQLAVATIRHKFGPLVPAVPDTGSLREDYLTVMRLMAERARHYTPDLLHGLLADTPTLAGEFFSNLPDVLHQILRNAVAHGELAHADLPERVASLPLDLIRYEGLRRTADQWPQLAVQAEELFAEILNDIFLPLVMALAGPGATR